MRRISIILLLLLFIAPLSYAQPQENKKEQADEIDWTKTDFFATGRVAPTPPFAPPDYDHYTGKVVFSANISSKKMERTSDIRAEVFIAEAKRGRVMMEKI